MGVSEAKAGSVATRSGRWATHASAWIDDRVEIGVRLALLPMDNWHYTMERDSRFDLSTDPVVRALPRVDVSVRDRSRRLLSAEAMYHFARGRPVWPFLGGAIGQRSDRGLSSCAPTGCERLLSYLASPVGRYASANANITIIAGISGRLNRRLFIRGGTRLHNFGGEGLSTAEASVSTSYRF